jgi:hypothetical protein
MRYLRRALAGLAVFVGGLLFWCKNSGIDYIAVADYRSHTNGAEVARQVDVAIGGPTQVCGNYVSVSTCEFHFASLHARTQKRNGPFVPVFAGGIRENAPQTDCSPLAIARELGILKRRPHGV